MSGGIIVMRVATSSDLGRRARRPGTPGWPNPDATASTPEMESPVTIISIAVRMPRNHAWNCMSGMPNRTAG